jgi:SAM-dependent methyltransferase
LKNKYKAENKILLPTMDQKDWFASWFNTSFYHDLYAKRNDEEAKAFMDSLSVFFKWDQHVKILDACCGSGRHALYLESKGFQVFGLDLSENNILQAKSLSENPHRWQIADVRDFELPQKVDYTLNLFTSFGYFNSDDEHVEMLKNINRNLIDGGKLVLDFLNVDRVKASLKEEETVKGVLAEYHLTRSIQSNRIVKQIAFSDGDVHHFFEERVMAYSSEQITQLLALSGFEVLTIWGDYQGVPMLPSSPRCIFIAQKNSNI